MLENLLLPLKEKAHHGHMNVRFLSYLLESLPIIAVRRLLQSKNPNLIQAPSNFPEIAKHHTQMLIEEDKRMIRRGLYSYPEFSFTQPRKHLVSYVRLLKDSVNAAMRARKNKNSEFSSDIAKDIENYPEYYRRNFHYQTDGYLSKESADLYEHQTEILFRGSLALMRRVLLAPVCETLKYNKTKKLKVLEIACGTGEAIDFLSSNYSNFELYAIDLSEAYLEKAKEKVKNNLEVNFQKMAAEDLKFSNDEFDIVYCCFLHHELPQEIRKKSFEEAYRVLKPGGKFVMVDSVQKGDQPDFDWALHNFPIEFHEPFYKNYTQKPVIELHQGLNITNLQEEVQLLSKSFSYIKGEENS